MPINTKHDPMMPNLWEACYSPLFETAPHEAIEAAVAAGWRRGPHLVVTREGDRLSVRSITEAERAAMAQKRH